MRRARDVTFQRLDLQDFCAKIAEDLAGERPHYHGAHFENMNAFEERNHVPIILGNPFSSSCESACGCCTRFYIALSRLIIAPKFNNSLTQMGSSRAAPGEALDARRRWLIPARCRAG